MARRWKWLGHEELAVSTADTLLVKDVLPEVSIDKGQTLARIVGDVLIGKVTPDTSVRSYGMGLILVDEGATAAAGVPDPLEDYDADWMWLRNGWIRRDAVADRAERLYLVDNHSMRKVRGDDKLVMVMHSITVAMDFAYCFRVGIKLA